MNKKKLRFILLKVQINVFPSSPCKNAAVFLKVKIKVLSNGKTEI